MPGRLGFLAPPFADTLAAGFALAGAGFFFGGAGFLLALPLDEPPFAATGFFAGLAGSRVFFFEAFAESPLVAAALLAAPFGAGRLPDDGALAPLVEAAADFGFAAAAPFTEAGTFFAGSLLAAGAFLLPAGAAGRSG